MPDKERLHAYARTYAERVPELNKKLVRYNDIVDASITFYSNDVEEGIRECIDSCRPNCYIMYDGKNTLAQSLQNNYKWIKGDTK